MVRYWSSSARNKKIFIQQQWIVRWHHMLINEFYFKHYPTSVLPPWHACVQHRHECIHYWLCLNLIQCYLISLLSNNNKKHDPSHNLLPPSFSLPWVWNLVSFQEKGHVVSESIGLFYWKNFNSLIVEFLTGNSVILNIPSDVKLSHPLLQKWYYEWLQLPA